MSDAGAPAAGAPMGGPAPVSASQFAGQQSGGPSCAFGAHAATEIGPGGYPVCKQHAVAWGVASGKRRRRRKHKD